jgi:ssDNA-binding Zn-finger/Zn-ribbon topoisomerase 1
MCNGFNHPPGCTCGWGGVWYGGTGDSDTWLFNRPLYHPRKLGRQEGTYQSISRGYTQPNARCPVCGQRVYFYASPYGGRVFFDDLGPPWPKHPCTDHTLSAPQPARPQPRSPAGLAWLGEAHLRNVGADTYEIQGTSDGKRYQFHFDAAELVMAELVRFRLMQHGQVELHILDYNDERRCWVTWQGVGRVKRESSATQGKLRQSVIHQHNVQTLRVTPGKAAGYQHTTVVQHGILAAEPKEQNVAPRQIKIAPDGLHECPRCRAHMARKRIRRHLLDVHKVAWTDLPTLPPMQALESVAPKQTVKLIPCPECATRISPKNLLRHRKRVHGAA